MRGAWGLTLAAADVPAVMAWGQQRDMACRATRKSARTIECHANEGSMLSHLWDGAHKLTVVFHFDESGSLSAMRALAAFASDARAAEVLGALAAQVQQDVGGEPAPHEPISAQALAGGSLNQIRVTFPRKNLYADVSATQLGHQVSVQQYLQVL